MNGIGDIITSASCSLLGIGCSSGETTGIQNPVIGNLGSDPDAAKSGATFIVYFISIWRALISVGAILVIVFFVWGALEWITAGGDSGKIQKARDRIMQAIIGLIILVGSFVIINLISNLFFGEAFQILNPAIPDPQRAASSIGL